MAKNIDFTGPYLKTERANKHIAELESVFRDWIDSNNKSLGGQPQDNRWDGLSIGGSLPAHTSTILGDAIHNLRSSLDHAYCVLVEAQGGTVNKHTKFPFTEKGTRQDLEASAKGQAVAAGGPSHEMLAFIFNEIQPFPGGNGQDLIGLHVLDIADKHTVLLPTYTRTHFNELRLQNVLIRGATIVSKSGAEMVLGSDMRLENNDDGKTTFEICFGDGQPFEGQPVLPILKGLARRVKHTLELLERRAITTSLGKRRPVT
jgi:hypothetical protein